MSTGRTCSRLLAIAIAVAPLCLAGQASSASDQINSAPRDWTDERQLTLQDFLAPPDAKSKGAALTTYEIQARRVCEVDGPAFRVAVRFLPTQSWIKPPQRTARILAHEQGHFDLAEVTARQLRAELSALDLTCADGNSAFTRLVANFQARDRDLQRSYDTQTMFGTDAPAQLKWERQIDGWLRAASSDRQP